MEDYIEDATPCVQCGVVPTERIDYGEPMTLCGIPVEARLGTVLRCPKCNKHTGAHRQPGEAFREWNIKINKE